MKENNNSVNSPRGMFAMLEKTSKAMLLLSLLFGITSGVSSVILLSLINEILQNKAGEEGYRIHVFVATLLIMMISGLASNIFLVRLGQNSMFKIRMFICRQILSTSFRKLEEIGSSRIYSMLSDDIQSIVNAIESLPIFSISLATLVGGLIYLAWLSPTIFLIIIIFVVIGVSIYQAMANSAFRHFEKSREIKDSLFSHFRAIIFGAKELKLNRLRRDSFLNDELEPTSVEYKENYTYALTKFAFASEWGRLLLFLIIGLLIFVHSTSDNINNASLVGSVMAVIYLMGPLALIVNIIPVFSVANVAAKKISSLQLDPLPDMSRNNYLSSADLNTQLTTIELGGATYSHCSDTEDEFTLGPINLVLQPHEVVFLVGGNGSGKSTLLKMLTGLYVPENGEIRVNGKCVINEDNRDEYRQLFSVIFSDFHLFESLPHLPQENSENLDALLIEYIELLGLTEKVNIVDGRFSTILLSQGQRKRLALLCAYLEDRPVYVFDEWAADQDPLFKEIFYSQIIPDLKQRGKAVLLATHDDRYFHLADRIVKLESGRLVNHRL